MVTDTMPRPTPKHHARHTHPPPFPPFAYRPLPFARCPLPSMHIAPRTRRQGKKEEEFRAAEKEKKSVAKKQKEAFSTEMAKIEDEGAELTCRVEAFRAKWPDARMGQPLVG